VIPVTGTPGSLAQGRRASAAPVTTETSPKAGRIARPGTAVRKKSNK